MYHVLCAAGADGGEGDSVEIAAEHSGEFGSGQRSEQGAMNGLYAKRAPLTASNGHFSSVSVVGSAAPSAQAIELENERREKDLKMKVAQLKNVSSFYSSVIIYCFYQYAFIILLH